MLGGEFRSQIDHTDERQMATIRKMKGKWQVLIRKKYAKHITKSFVYRHDAEKYAREKEAEIDKGLTVNYEEAARTTLGELLERYRIEITSKKKSPHSEDCKIKYLIRQDIGHVALLRITPLRISKLRDQLSADRAPATVLHYLSYISNAWNVAQKEWCINLPQNPVSQISKPVIRNRRERILSKAEYARLLDAASRSKFYMKNIIIFAYETAARYGEITTLHKDNVNFLKRTCKFIDTKNGEDREVPLTEAALQALRDQPPSTKGTYFNPGTHDQFKHHWQKVKVAAEIENFRFHDLRACAITNFMLPPFNFTIAQTAVISGHKSWDELKRYERIKAEQLVDTFKRLKK